jgi:CRISPR-associated protein Csm1
MLPEHPPRSRLPLHASGSEAGATTARFHLAAAAALQAVWVFAGRASADAAGSLGALLERVESVLPASARDIWRKVCGGPLRGAAPLPEPAWQWLAQGWALAVGNLASNLNAPGQRAPERWHAAHRVRPVLQSLTAGARQAASGPDAASWRVWPLRPLDDEALDALTQAESATQPGQAAAWTQFMEALERDHRAGPNPSLRAWLDRLDSLLAIFLRGQPAYWEGMVEAREGATMTIDTLYDQQRMAGALGAALWRYDAHRAELARQRRPGRDKEGALILVAGQLAPIQDYIFGAHPHRGIDGHAVLRGRSAFARLLVELACRRVCEELEVPPSAVVVGSASKFTLVCANTAAVRERVKELQVAFDQWCLDELLGTANIMLATATLDRCVLETVRPASARGSAPAYGPQFSAVLAKLAARMADSKLHRFQLCKRSRQGPHPRLRWSPPLYLPAASGAAGTPRCALDGRLPARRQLADGWWMSNLGRFQWNLAHVLAGETPVLSVTDSHRHPGARPASAAFRVLGYSVAAECGSACDAIQDPHTDLWDLGSVSPDGRVPWRGRRRLALALPQRPGALSRGSAPRPGLCMALKGDVDRLGAVFSERLPRSNLSRLGALSREIEEFFTIRLLRMSWRHGTALTPILAGGDDFVFIGDPSALMAFAREVQQAWSACTAGGATLSIGLSLPHPATSASSRALVEEADAALELAKSERDAVGFAGECWPWARWHRLAQRMDELTQALEQRSVLSQDLITLAEPLQRLDSGDPLAAAHAKSLLASTLQRMERRPRPQAGQAVTSLPGLFALDEALGPAELLTAMALADQLHDRAGRSDG